jgi:hypothetical protein
MQEDRVLGDINALPQVAFNDLSPEEQEKWSQEMTHTAIGLFSTPSEYEPWANGVPCKYIYCEKDNALPLPIQKQMSMQLGPEPKAVTLDASHCPHLSMPDKLIAAIDELAA